MFKQGKMGETNMSGALFFAETSVRVWEILDRVNVTRGFGVLFANRLFFFA